MTLLRLSLAAVAIGLLLFGIANLMYRRPTADRPPIDGIFSVLAGLALLAESYLMVGEFGVVGGVLVLCAGAVALIGAHNADG